MLHSTPTPPGTEQRIAEIIVSVRTAFAEKGFDGASMQDLARAAGMSVGNFYRCLLYTSGTQAQKSPIRAAGSPPISTVIAPTPTIGRVAPMQIGQVCMSVRRAAGNPGIPILFPSMTRRLAPALPRVKEWKTCCLLDTSRCV